MKSQVLNPSWSDFQSSDIFCVSYILMGEARTIFFSLKVIKLITTSNPIIWNIQLKSNIRLEKQSSQHDK